MSPMENTGRNYRLNLDGGGRGARAPHLAVAFVAVTSAALLGCGAEEPPEASAPAVRPVKLLVIGLADQVTTHRYPAVVEAARTSELAFPVGGVLHELAVTEARQVAAGALLARLDDRDYAVQAESARSEYDSAEAAYQRAVRLLEGNAISRGAVEERKSRRDTAKAAFDRARNALDDTVLRAPFSGVVARIHVRNFQSIQPNQAIVTLIGGGGAFEAAVDLPAAVIAASGAQTDVRAHVVFDAAPGVRVPAVYEEAVLEAASESQTYEVRFRFRPPEGLVVLPGMSATVEMEVPAAAAPADAPPAVAVPLAAVGSDGGGSFVWVIDPEEMTASKRAVEIAPAVGETVTVTGGLEPGETIAGAGAAYLAEGMRVRPWAA